MLSVSLSHSLLGGGGGGGGADCVLSATFLIGGADCVLSGTFLIGGVGMIVCHTFIALGGWGDLLCIQCNTLKKYTYRCYVDFTSHQYWLAYL